MNSTDQELTRAITYLLLRQRKLSHISAVSYKKLSDYMDAYDKTGTLHHNAFTHITNLEKNQSTTKFGFNNLQAVYAYDCCITQALTKVDKDGQKFLASIQEFLRKNLYLTKKQVEAVENWLQYIPQHRPLDPSGFFNKQGSKNNLP